MCLCHLHLRAFKKLWRLSKPFRYLLIGFSELNLGALAGCTAASIRTLAPELQVSAATSEIKWETVIGPIRIWGDTEPEWFDEFVSLRIWVGTVLS